MTPEKTYIEIVERIYNTESNYQYIHPHTCAICTSYEVALARKAYELWKTNNELYLSKHPNAVLN